MLTTATLDDIERYQDVVYQLSLDQTRSSYPTYADGIKTKQDFIDAARDAVLQPDQELLLYSYNGVMEGWLQYFRIPAEQYLQLCGCSIQQHTAQALDELLALLAERFPGDTFYFGFPAQNTAAIDALQRHGFRCIETSDNHSFFFDGDIPCPADDHVARIDRQHFDDFRTIHAQMEADTYWTAERMLAQLDDWNIYVYYRDGVPVGTAFYQQDDTSCEIFGVEFTDGIFDDVVFHALLTAVLHQCRSEGMKFLTYFSAPEERSALAALGFRRVGQYMCYVKTF